MSARKAKGARGVLVTGGSRGLGLAIAQKLAAAGYRTIAVARTESKEITAAIAHAERAHCISYRSISARSITFQRWCASCAKNSELCTA